MKRRDFLLTVAAAGISIVGVSAFTLKTKALIVYAGSVNIPPLEEIISEYSGDVKTVYGGSGNILSQAIISKRGDIYIPGSNEFMDLAIEKGVVYEESVRKLAYIIPVIVVRKDNPKNIKRLGDLVKDDVRLAIANPKSVAIGLYAVEMFEYNGLDVKKNIVAKTKSFSDLLTLLKTGVVDAVIGWNVAEVFSPDLKVIYPRPEEIPRVACVEIGIMRFAEDVEKARDFLEFVYERRSIYEKYGFITSEKMLKELAPNAKVGGKFENNWRNS